MFKKPTHAPSEDELRFQEMKDALHQYTDSLKEYYSHLGQDVDSGSPYAQMLLQKVEVHRDRYFKLRMQYEVQYGDVVSYQSKLKQFFAWRKEINLSCLFQQPHDQYTIISSLDSPVLTQL